MPRVHVDGRTYEVGEGKQLLEACLELGMDLPYFCWHPGMGSVGACRQCAVKQYRDEDDDQGKIVMACMTPAGDGTRISIDDPEARAMRAHVVEWLMANHPHDCPVCDEGGECHLQDMTVLTGHRDRRFRFDKRTHHNQDLGPFIHHEMNRCIQCYRCVRFYSDVAGGDDLQAFAAHDHVYFGRHEDGTLESGFSGNLVEVCPTGVFTDRTLAGHYTRKWDLTTAPSVCTHCSVGCNTTPGARGETVRRIRNRYHDEINGYFLCDRGRYGYGFADHVRRLGAAFEPGEGQPRELSVESAIARAGELLGGASAVVGIGSPRASLEANFALRALADEFSDGLDADARVTAHRVRDLFDGGPVRAASLAEVREADAAIVLGNDPTASAPLLSLALRRCALNQPAREAVASGIPSWHDAAVREFVQDRRGPLFLFTQYAGPLDDVARRVFHGPPVDQLARARRLVDAIEGRASDDEDEEIARSLEEADRVVVVVDGNVGDGRLLTSAAALAGALPGDVGVAVAAREANDVGQAVLDGDPLDPLLDRMEAGEVDLAIVLENDLFRRATRERVERALERTPTIVIDHLATPTARHARLVLPSANLFEAAGSFMNCEGRRQHFVPMVVPASPVRAAWRWLAALGKESGRDAATWNDFTSLLADLGRLRPTLEADLVVDDLDAVSRARASLRIPRQLERYSGRTALHADESMREPRPPADPDSYHVFSMEGFQPSDVATAPSEVWAPRWNSVQSLHRFQEEIEGPLRGSDPGRRLFEPGSRDIDLDPGPIEDFTPRRGHLRLLRRPELFGDDELAALSSAVRERTSPVTLWLHPDDGGDLDAGDVWSVDLGHERLPARIAFDTSLAAGTAALGPQTDGVPPASTWPAWIENPGGGS